MSQCQCLPLPSIFGCRRRSCEWGKCVRAPHAHARAHAQDCNKSVQGEAVRAQAPCWAQSHTKNRDGVTVLTSDAEQQPRKWPPSHWPRSGGADPDRSCACLAVPVRGRRSRGLLRLGLNPACDPCETAHRCQDHFRAFLAAGSARPAHVPCLPTALDGWRCQRRGIWISLAGGKRAAGRRRWRQRQGSFFLWKQASRVPAETRTEAGPEPPREKEGLKSQKG